MKPLIAPYIPAGAASLVVIDYRADTEIENTLNESGIECLRTYSCSELYDSINGHPDIMLHHIGDNKIVLAPNVYDKLAPELEKKGFALTKGATWLSRNYPGNIAYNVLRIGSIALHNTKHTDIRILEEFEKLNVKLIHTNQGYTKCSVCIVSESAIITSDRKISMEVEKHGIESLLIKPGGIELLGFEYGFIGGATGLISEDTMAFSGALDKMQDADKILRFLESKKKKVKILMNKPICDIGSIVPLKCQ
ncbi:MAG: DUF6873 family GME fold protein [Bacillota bacterium]